MLNHARVRALAALVLALALTAACGGPTKEEYFASGEAFAKEGKFPEAIVQYRNAVALDAQYGEARYKLGDAYVKTNDLPRAMGEYIRAADLMPANLEAQLQAARFLLLARRFEDAQTRTEKALAIDANNVEAQIAKATALAGQGGAENFTKAISQVEEAITLDPDNARSHMILGLMQRSQEHMTEAEAAFKRAVEVAPKSVDAKQALATFYWTNNRLPEAEDWLRQSVALDPTNLASQRALATFLIVQGRAAEAEAPLKAVAEATKATPAQLALADYYLGQRRFDDARPLLNAAAAKDDGFVPAKIRLAQLDFGQERRDAAHQAIKDVLARDAKQVDALVLQTRMLLSERKPEEALASAHAAIAANPQAAAAQNILGDANVAGADPDKAMRAYNQALRLNPRIVSAKLKVAQLQMQKGDAESAVIAADDAVRQSPTNPAAKLLRARALTLRGDYARAQTDLDELTKDFPKAATVHAQMGELHLARQNRAAARRSFEQALAINPDLFEGLRGRIFVDLVDGKADQAKLLAERQLEKSPNNPQLLLLAAGVYSAMKDTARQEATLNKLVEIDPDNLQGFAALASLYVRQGKLDQARDKYEALGSRGSNTVAAKTMVGLIYEAQNRRAEATAAYEKLLEVEPEAAVAANNLAWRYAEDGGNLDVALSLAQTAKRKLPDSAEVSDTLGWIYLKKDLDVQAVTAFQDSVRLDPNTADYQYHLGMALAKTRDRARADQAFGAALKLKPDHKEAAAARQTLGYMR